LVDSLFVDKCTRPKNWPTSIEYVPNLILEELPETVKDRLHSPVIPGVEIRSSAADGLGLFAAKDMACGYTIGEYTGQACVNGDDGEDSKDVQFVRNLYEDEEISVAVDASDSGNELRFIRDCKKTEKPNVTFVPVQANGTWRLTVMTTVEVKTGQELLADLSVNHMKTEVLSPSSDHLNL